MTAARPSHPPRPRRGRPQRERGAVLIVALVVLVALGLAALSLLRSVDVLGLVAGNLSFQRSALNSSDVGVQKAVGKFSAVLDKTVSSSANCYSAVMEIANERGIPNVLADLSAFQQAYPGCSATTDAGETVYFFIDRQCGRLGIVSKDIPCLLAKREASGVDSLDTGEHHRDAVSRVTVRVEGVKNATSYTQTLIY